MAGKDDYEKLRVDNIQKNEEFLQSLGLDKLKPEKVQTKKRVYHDSGREKKAKLEPTRRSGRMTIERLKLDISEAESKAEDDDALSSKREILAEMMSKKEETIYRVEAAEQWHRRSPSPFSMIPPSNQPTTKDDDIEDNMADNWGKPIIEVLKSLTIDTVTETNSKSKGSSSCKYQSDAEYDSAIERLQMCQPTDVTKVVEERISATAIHPSEHKIVVLAGDKTGCLGIWDVDYDSSSHSDGDGPKCHGVYKYQPHVYNICAIHCTPTAASNIYTASYDGTIRHIDLQKEAFSLVFETPEDLGDVILSDVFFSPDNYSVFVGRGDGMVGCVDIRTKPTAYSWLQSWHEAKVNSIQQHPTQENTIITACSRKDGYISFHDIRKVSSAGSGAKKSSAMASELYRLDEHSKSINAALVSPDGRHLVSVSMDDTIRIWDVNGEMFGGGEAGRGRKKVGGQEAGSSISKAAVIKHNNATGRWLSVFKPVFDPKHPNSFLCGSMTSPRVMDVFTIKGKGASSIGSAPQISLPNRLSSDYMASVCSRNAIHPTLNVVAGGNSSGRVHVFRESV